MKYSHLPKSVTDGAFSSYCLGLKEELRELNRKGAYLLFALNFPTDDKERFISFAMGTDRVKLYKFIINYWYDIADKETRKTIKSFYIKKKPIFEDIYKKYGFDYNSIRCNYPILKEFMEAVYIDTEEEEIKVDIDVFFSLFEDRTIIQQSNIYKLHLKACKALNDFFQGVRVTEKDIERYFVFNGRVKPNPKSICPKGYIRLNWNPKASKQNNKKKEKKVLSALDPQSTEPNT